MKEKRRLIFSIDSNIVLLNCIDRDKEMEKVKLSPKFQIVIPKKIRRSLGLKPGQKIHVIPMGHRIELIPERRLGEMRGFLKGISTEPEREEDRL
jgi:AbrB family looped-hinge helix DNA binding protein